MTKKEFIEMFSGLGKKTECDPKEAVKKFTALMGKYSPIDNVIPKKGKRKWKQK